jgi:hypothetical protein
MQTEQIKQKRPLDQKRPSSTNDPERIKRAYHKSGSGISAKRAKEERFLTGELNERDEAELRKAERLMMLKGNYLVKTPIARVENLSDRAKKGTGRAGRPAKYSTTRLRNEINRYFTWCEENDRVPSITGMMLHLKLTKELFYRSINNNDKFADIYEHARLVIKEWCENDVYRTPGAAAGKIAYMKNVHGWSEKIDSVNQNFNETKQVISVEDATARIAALAPALLEALKGNLLNQLSLPEQKVIEIHNETV